MLLVKSLWGVALRKVGGGVLRLRRDHQVTVQADLDAWAREHWLNARPWAERVRVVRVMD